MLNVLLNAYAISPSWGSEQGVGWHWMIEIAKHCRVFVITEGQWRDEIEEAIQTLPQKENIMMYYNPVSERVRRMCWNQGDWRFYFHYARWQRKTLFIAREIVRNNKIDVIHQLNMVGFREPGLLWKIKDIPYIWGPLGGAHPTNVKFVNGLVPSVSCLLKNSINRFQLKYSWRVRAAIRRAGILITPLFEDSLSIKQIYGKQTVVMSETGLEGGCINNDENIRMDSRLNLLWVGRMIPSKKLDIAIESIAAMNNICNVSLHIIGSGREEERCKRLAEEKGVSSNCIWYGKVEHTDVLQIMRRMDMLFFTSIHELTSTVVPEAIQNRLPILCHDAMGFGPVVEDGKTGFKIPLINPKQSISRFASILDRLSENRIVLNEMKNNFDEPAKSLSFEEKGKRVLEMYNQIIRTNF